MSKREEAKALWEKNLKAGYSPDEAKARVMHYAQTGIELPDPTERYWAPLIGQESGGNQDAVSPKGATGIAQVMPATGPEAAALAGVEWDPVAFKEDPVYNAQLGRAYFRKQMTDNGNDPAKALAAYNAGPGALRRAGGDLSKLPQETQNYVPAIMNRADKGMQPDLDNPEDVEAAREALMSPRDRARKAYESVLASGGSAEEAKAAAMQFAAQRPAPVTQQPAVQVPSTPPPQAASPTDPMVRKIPNPVERQAELLQGDMGDRFAAGLERSIGGVDRGARKLLAQLMGNDEQLNKANSQESAIREQYDKYDPAGSGFSAADAGKITGDIAGAATLGKVLPGSGISGGALAGGAQGLLQPTTADESQLVNAGVGGALGGALGGVGKAISYGVGTKDPQRALLSEALRAKGVDIPAGQEYNSPIGAALRKMGGEKGSSTVPEKSLTSELAKLMGISGEDITNSSVEANTRRAGSAIGDMFEGATATPNREFFKEVLETGRKYQLSGPVSRGDKTSGMIDHLLDLSKSGAPITAEKYQALRTGLSANSVTGSAAEKQAMGGMKRALDDLFSKQNPRPEAGELRSQYRLSKILRSGSGIPADGMTVKQLRNRIEGAAGKGEVSSSTRELLSEASQLIPKARIGGDAVAGAGDDVAIRGVERPSLISALAAAMRGVAGPASKAYDKGLIQKLVNDPTTRASLSSLLRGGILPSATPKGEQ